MQQTFCHQRRSGLLHSKIGSAATFRRWCEELGAARNSGMATPTITPTPTCVLLSDRPDLIGAAASLLAAQWPASSATSRRSALLAHVRKAKKDEIPCHLLLLDADDAVVAHGRLQPACENADGFSAAITSVVVDASRRGTGLGRVLLQHAEAVAARCGFGYLYLWTHDAQAFYQRCGYSECEKVSLLRPSLIKLGSAAVNKLEALFQKRASDLTEGRWAPYI